MLAHFRRWYRRHECGLRMAIFFSAATAAGAFGGLLARGIMEMDGVGGKAGWAWIFVSRSPWPFEPHLIFLDYRGSRYLRRRSRRLLRYE